MKKYAATWDGRLGQILVKKHRLQFVKKTAPAHSYPYRAETLQSLLNRDELNRMLMDNVAASAATEWASQIFIVPKNNDSFVLALQKKTKYNHHEE